MKKLLKTSKLLIALGSIVVFAACTKDDDSTEKQETVSYGPYVNVGAGKARSFVINNPDGTTKQIGFRFNEASFTGLPNTYTTFVLPMPSDNKTLIDHISMDYAVHGHPPDQIYTVEHFDAHFYMISPQAKDAITVEDPRIEILPPVEARPVGYVHGGNEPKMGKHWTDTTGHEFHGQKFTSTFVYGSFDGKFIFLEPMIAISYLKTKPNVTIPITQLGKVPASGLYPENYSIEWETELKEYVVALKDLKAR